MTDAIASELIKLRTTRTFYGVVLGALALLLVIFLAGSLAGDFETTREPAKEILPIAGLAQTFALILGVLAITTEFRHGTITPSLLAVPQRMRLVAAKVVAHAGGGLVFGLLAFSLGALIVLLILPSRGIATGVDSGDVVGAILGGAVGTALFAVLGVGIGAVIRNQVGAIIIALAWVFVVEPLIGIIPGLEDPVSRYGLGGLGNALIGMNTGDTELLGRLPAGLVLAAYAAAFLIAGTALLRRRDVSA